MKQIVIIAPTGMLGSMVYKVLKEKYRLILVYRNKENLQKLFATYGKAKYLQTIQVDLEDIYKNYFNDKATSNEKIFNLKADAVINCAGLTKPNAKKNPALTFFINSAFPHLLSSVYQEKLIQIATDCVYSGLNGAPYKENAFHDPIDLYGLSKSLGEPSDKSLVLRTSIIGPEICGFTLLISWLRKQKEANGFTTHLWNGVTTRQFALICSEIIANRDVFPKKGLFHVFSNSITKYDLLVLLAKKYNPTCTIKPIKVEKVDRRLSTLYPVNQQLHIPSLEQQIQEL